MNHDYVAETLLLDGGVEDYEYLNKSRREVDGIDDREEWAMLKVGLNWSVIERGTEISF